MYTKSFLAVIMAGAAFAAPVTERQTSNNFVAIATHSGNANVHLRGITANGERFWLGKDTATYCPSTNVDCSAFTNSTTAFAATPNTAGGLSFDEAVPGGQQVYVTVDGQLGYTIAHSASSPDGSLKSPFLYTPQAQSGSVGNLQFNDNGFAACPDATVGVYQIYAAGVAGFVRTDCIGINIATSTYTGAPAWQYE